MSTNYTLTGFLRKEFIQVLRDPRMRIMLFLPAIIQMTLFGYALSNEVKNIRLAAYFKPSDTLTRKIYERSMASGWFVHASGTDPDPFHLIQADRAEVVIVTPPEGLTDAIQRNRPELQLLINATNVIRAQQIENYLKAIVQKVLKDEQIISSSPAPFSFRVRILYNPNMSSAVFMIPAIMCLLLSVVTTMLTSMSIAREKEMGTFEMLISTPIQTWELLLGKTLPFVVIGMINVPLILCIAVFVFDVPLRGSILLLSLAALIFICATVSIGTLISTISRNQQQAMLAGFLFLFPAIMFSGMMFPIENMPPLVQWIAYLDPLMYFVSLLRSIMLKGGNIAPALKNIGALFAISCFCVWLSFNRFRHSLN